MRVKRGQSLIDIAIQECGSAEAAYNLATLNGLSVSDSPVPGSNVDVPGVLNGAVSSLYLQRGIVPATLFEIEMEGVERVFFEEMSLEFS